MVRPVKADQNRIRGRDLEYKDRNETKGRPNGGGGGEQREGLRVERRKRGKGTGEIERWTPSAEPTDRMHDYQRGHIDHPGRTKHFLLVFFFALLLVGLHTHTSALGPYQLSIMPIRRSAVLPVAQPFQ